MSDYIDEYTVSVPSLIVRLFFVLQLLSFIEVVYAFIRISEKNRQ